MLTFLRGGVELEHIGMLTLRKQRERPKPRRKGKYRDVSNPSTSSHMNQGPSHEMKKYTPKARKSELEEEEVESLPPIPPKSVSYREEKPARSGPPGFNQPKRNDPVPTVSDRFVFPSSKCC